MKKTPIVLLMALMLLAMAACGGREASPPEPTPTPEATTPQTSPEPTPAEPAPGGGAVEPDVQPETKPEIEAEIGIDADLELDAVPEDIAGIIRASAVKWMENVFEGTGTAEYECAELSLYDVAESSFCYSMAFARGRRAHGGAYGREHRGHEGPGGLVQVHPADKGGAGRRLLGDNGRWHRRGQVWGVDIRGRLQ